MFFSLKQSAIAKSRLADYFLLKLFNRAFSSWREMKMLGWVVIAFAQLRSCSRGFPDGRWQKTKRGDGKQIRRYVIERILQLDLRKLVKERMNFILTREVRACTRELSKKKIKNIAHKRSIALIDTKLKISYTKFNCLFSHL